MTVPDFSEFKRLAGQYPAVALSRVLRADIKTPVEVLRIFKSVSRHVFLLESCESPEKWGRFSFLGVEPKLELTARGGVVTIRNGTSVSVPVEHPKVILRKILAENRLPRLEGQPPFVGGLVGYFSFEYFHYAEPSICFAPNDDERFPDVDLMLFDETVAFDHLRQEIILTVVVKSDEGMAGYRRGEIELDKLARLLEGPTPPESETGRLESELAPLFDEEAFCENVRRGKEFIRRGDIFQVVLSNRLSGQFSGSLLDVYRTLRMTNPSPYLFYLGSDSLEIAGSSPETLLKVTSSRLETFPLAGSRPRGSSPEEDKRLAKELLADQKELAEHNMLVDLGRNDLGRVSQFGSVKVEEHLNILRYSHIMHLGSTVSGVMKPEYDALDALDAVLPAGTLSGAPKIRACQIIAELEKTRRGVYGGAIGYLDFTGNLDAAIAIRFAYRKDGRVHVRSGAGIVADSVPETEYVETLNKARAVVNALAKKEETR